MSLALAGVIGYLIFRYLSAPAKSVDKVYRLRQIAEARRASEAGGG